LWTLEIINSKSQEIFDRNKLLSYAVGLFTSRRTTKSFARWPRLIIQHTASYIPDVEVMSSIGEFRTDHVVVTFNLSVF